MNSQNSTRVRNAGSILCSSRLPTVSILMLMVLLVPACSNIPNRASAVRNARYEMPLFDPSNSKERICLSMRVLVTEAKADPRREEVRDLAGIGWLEGYVVDAENQDVILLGRRSSKWPTLQMDDLAVNIRNVWQGNSYPYCSLDPRAKDVLNLKRIASGIGVITSVEQMHSVFERIKSAWGDQKVVVGGVPKNSRHAHVMIDADYHMKKVSQGLVEVKAIPSYMDLAVGQAQESLQRTGTVASLGMSMSRFWFHIGKGHPTYEESKGIVWLKQCAVVLLTEKQRATADGTLYDSGGDDPNAKAFAEILSQRFRYAATVVPEYADLENLFRLTSLLRAMHLRNVVEKAKLDLTFYLTGYKFQGESSMPPSMPGLVNGKQVTDTIKQGGLLYQYVLFPMVCGGVSMEIRATKEQFIGTKEPHLDNMRIGVLRSRPHRNALWWHLKTP